MFCACLGERECQKRLVISTEATFNLLWLVTDCIRRVVSQTKRTWGIFSSTCGCLCCAAPASSKRLLPNLV